MPGNAFLRIVGFYLLETIFLEIKRLISDQCSHHYARVWHQMPPVWVILGLLQFVPDGDSPSAKTDEKCANVHLAMHFMVLMHSPNV